MPNWDPFVHPGIYIYIDRYVRARETCLWPSRVSRDSPRSQRPGEAKRREANWNHRGSHGTLASTQPLARAKSMAKRPLEVRCAASTPGRGLWGLSDISCFYIYIIYIYNIYIYFYLTISRLYTIIYHKPDTVRKQLTYCNWGTPCGRVLFFTQDPEIYLQKNCEHLLKS